MSPVWFKREIHPGDSGPDVKVIQRKLGVEETGIYDAACEQRIRGLFSQPFVDQWVADQLGETAAHQAGLAPDWFLRPLTLGCEGEDVHSLARLMGTDPSSLFTADLDAAVRRFQSEADIVPTGVVDQHLAMLIGEA